ncbi:MAG: hypothetical protein OXI34_13200 [Chloroflexota bacterium]|nr:hypothetical protein [Chloroflexota bacterium]MDE2948313.1 hypothetical protein [Chloroflexota bacterium]
MAEETNLEKMRYDSLVKITRTMGGAALSGAVPTPTLELAKQLGISIADAWMCFDIYKTYFGKELSKQDLARMLGATGVVVLGGGIAGYVGIRLAQALLSEILEQIPIANSVITGIAFGSSTFVIGLAWLAIVEQNYFLGRADES